jgi:hypothetical protein
MLKKSPRIGTMNKLRADVARSVMISALVLASLPSPASASPRMNHVPTTSDLDQDGLTDDEEGALGLDPDVVNIPEPLLFDMIRGLDARRGELELNALVQTSPRRSPAFSGGPEVEYVFAKGHGLEVELPVSTSGVDAWKGSLQGTLPHPTGHFNHGWLLTGEYLLGDPGARVTGTYIAALRFNRHWSALTMIGGRIEKQRGAGTKRFGVLNPSLFFDASPYVTIGLEMNSLLEDDGTTDLVLLPQLHWQPTKEWKVQLGGGAHVDEAGATLLSALRLSYMY